MQIGGHLCPHFVEEKGTEDKNVESQKLRCPSKAKA
jgi:hypothetical protein